jgi:HAE1 family hydrophobic/amphiphilic exporter-1
MIQQFITRPVLSIVVSIFIVILGVIAMQQLPITQFPDIAPPAVTVTTKYTGANAEVCAKAVVTPLERAINGVAGMAYMTSVSGNDGTSIIQVYFEVGTDPDVAAVNVQNRVTTVLDELPEEVSEGYYNSLKETEPNPITSLIRFGASFGGKFEGGFARGKTNKGESRNYWTKSSK